MEEVEGEVEGEGTIAYRHENTHIFREKKQNARTICMLTQILVLSHRFAVSWKKVRTLAWNWSPSNVAVMKSWCTSRKTLL